MKKYKCKDFAKTGRVLLPKKWREKFKLLPGQYVTVQNIGKKILIKKGEPQSMDNQRLLTDQGSVIIPKEIRSILDIDANDEYCIYVDDLNECFILELDKAS